MKFNMSIPFFDERTREVLALMGQEVPKDSKTVLGVIAALLVGSPDERATPEEKGRRWDILCRLREGAEIELSIEDLGLLKKLIDAGSPVIAHGRLTQFLNTPLP